MDDDIVDTMPSNEVHLDVDEDDDCKKVNVEKQDTL